MLNEIRNYQNRSINRMQTGTRKFHGNQHRQLTDGLTKRLEENVRQWTSPRKKRKKAPITM